ncbi:hypothetical protein ACFY1U_32560 [Streptomyces sp. NPDC001351]|uniref:hypothetical protein n=1 Tax=Streptomyces sp. NPDC001351 TaxID=3364564 RepID=UPI00367FE711
MASPPSRPPPSCAPAPATAPASPGPLRPRLPPPGRDRRAAEGPRAPHPHPGLVVPPAWREVRICPWPHGHLRSRPGTNTSARSPAPCPKCAPWLSWNSPAAACPGPRSPRAPCACSTTLTPSYGPRCAAAAAGSGRWSTGTDTPGTTCTATTSTRRPAGRPAPTDQPRRPEVSHCPFE